MRSHRLFTLCSGILFILAMPATVSAQEVICCSELFNVEGNWIGASRNCAAGLAGGKPERRAAACRQLTNCAEARTACPRCDEEALKKAREDYQRWLKTYADISKNRDALSAESSKIVDEAEKLAADFFISKGRGLLMRVLGSQVKGTRWEQAPRVYKIYTSKGDRDAAIKEAAHLLKDAAGTIRNAEGKKALGNVGTSVQVIELLMELGFLNAKMLTLLDDLKATIAQAETAAAAALDALKKAREAKARMDALEAECRAVPPTAKPKPPTPAEDEDEWKPTGQREFEEAQRLVETWKQADGTYQDANGTFHTAGSALQEALRVVQSQQKSSLRPAFQSVSWVAQSSEQARLEQRADAVARGLENMAAALESHQRLSAQIEQTKRRAVNVASAAAPAQAGAISDSYCRRGPLPAWTQIKPGRGLLEVGGTTREAFAVLDSTGKTVANQTVGGRVELAPGTYALRLNNSAHTTSVVEDSLTRCLPGALVVSGATKETYRVKDATGKQLAYGTLGQALSFFAPALYVSVNQSDAPTKLKPGRTEEIKAGTVIVHGTTSEYYYVHDTTGKQLGYGTLGKPFDVLPGSYIVKVNKTETVAAFNAGETREIATGTLLVRGSTSDYYYVTDASGKELHYQQLNKPLSFFPGTYRVRVNKTERPASVTASRETEYQTGSIVATGKGADYYYVLDKSNNSLHYNTLNKPLSLFPGEYSVKVGPRVRAATVSAGKTTSLEY